MMAPSQARARTAELWSRPTEHGGLIGQGAGEGQQDVNMQGWKSNPADRWGLWQGLETREGLQEMLEPSSALHSAKQRQPLSWDFEWLWRKLPSHGHIEPRSRI